MQDKRLKIVFLIIIAIFLFKGTGYAVPAAPIKKTLQQPDGTEFIAKQWGDEWLHGWETIDGYTIVKDKSIGYWHYAISDGKGQLKSSGKIVGLAEPSPDIPKHIRPHRQRYLRRTKITKVVPSTGTAYIPVILINFNDTTTTYSTTYFDTLLFGTTGSSMKVYYEEVSYNNFTISAGPSGIVGWYTASQNHDYYGTDDYDAALLVIEAVQAADTAGFDFSAYDQNEDCYVDVVSIIHQGTGEEVSGTTGDIWSHKWDLESAKNAGYGTGEVTTDDICPSNTSEFIKVNDYIIQPELYSNETTPVISTIGVFAHEYGHALGLPDLYDTDGSSEGIGRWSLMAGGSWNYTTTPGDTPAHLDAWSKYYLGWVTPTLVDKTLTSEAIEAASTAADVYRLFGGTPTSGEYFLVENRQKTNFDAGLPGEGLLIWHIDGDSIANNISSNTVNTNECYPPNDCSSSHYGVALIQADNQWDLEKGSNDGDDGDPFPGSSQVTSFSDTTTPNSKLYDGTSSYVSVTDISPSQPIMTATLSVTPPDLSTTEAPTPIKNTGHSRNCFIATAAYGSPMHPYVKALRDFRDKYLLNNSWGRTFVDLYYKYSPPIAEKIAGNEFLKLITRILLIPAIMLVAFPYTSLAILFALVLLSIVMLRTIFF
jgi:M6 family metalloprotease-like protein